MSHKPRRVVRDQSSASGDHVRPDKKNTILETCARLQEHNKILAFSKGHEARASILERLAQLSWSARSLKKNRRPAQPPSPSSSAATSSQQVDNLAKDVEDLEIRRDAAKHSLGRVQQQRRELMKMLGWIFQLQDKWSWD